jgi:hypothetical protein
MTRQARPLLEATILAPKQAECTVFLPMSGKNHEGNKSPDIYDSNDQRGSLCSWAMKAYKTQGSSVEGSKEGRTRADKAVTGSKL